MATDFFQRQGEARRNTAWLIAMFVLATIAIVVATFFATWLAMSQIDSYRSAFGEESLGPPLQIPGFAAGGALLMVTGGSLYKVAELRAGGGAAVAQHLGGKQLLPGSSEPGQRRLLNVVEEMAIASGVPTPPVYLLDEPGINAFAAGYSPSDAVVGVTRGAVDRLSREELQGVIAHEFSHILNGDMRTGIRMIGILHGVLLLGLIGQMLLRSTMYTRTNSRDRSGVLPILLIGVALFVLGYVGTFIGGLIKAAVSRQREYLADASAVQFTRNPHGIAGALKRIGGAVGGSRIRATAAAEASHLFFAQGVWEGFSGLMATHPPLAKRIRAIDPNWDGQFLTAASPTTRGFAAPVAAGLAGAAVPRRYVPATQTSQVDIGLVDNAVQQVGEPEERHREYAAQLIEAMPAELLQAVREPFGARAVIYCLLLDPRKEIRQRQVASLRAAADPAVLREAAKLQTTVASVDPRARIPLVDLSIPALRLMSRLQFDSFSKCLHALIAADESLGLFEWTLGRVVDRHLAAQYEKRRRTATLYYGLQRLDSECSMLLSTMAHVGHSGDAAGTALATARPLLPKVKLRYLHRRECSLAKLRGALETLSQATAPLRGQVLDACAEVVCADGHVGLAEAELIRGIADLLDCPVPPLVAGQQVTPASSFREPTP